MMNTRRRTYRCGDKKIKDARFQPVVLVERIFGLNNRGVCYENDQGIFETVKIKSEVVEETSDLFDRSEPNGVELSIPSLNLYLSPDTEEENDADYMTTEVKEEPFSESTFLSSHESPSNHNEQQENIYGQTSQFTLNDYSNQIRSQDMYQDSSLSSDRLSVGQNREKTEEWDSQELKNVSLRLRRRREQVKKMFTEVIKKRQVADETLEVVKKRLKRL